RLLPGGAGHLRQSHRRGEPAPAAAGRAGRAERRGDLRSVPELARATAEPGHEALRRRAADAGHWPNSADRRAALAPRRADGGTGAGDRAADRRDDSPAEGRGLHDLARRAELPLRGDGGRSPPRDGARAGRRHHRQRRSRPPHGHARRVPRRMIAPHLSPLERSSTMAGMRSAMFALVLLLAAGAAEAQISDGIIKIGVLNDQSSLYADLTGQGSVVAARMAVEDFGAAAKGMKVEIIFADHQNKADVGANIARQWYDSDKVDVIVDVPNSAVALAVNQITRDKGKAFLVSGAATSDLTGKACSPNTIHWTYD